MYHNTAKQPTYPPQIIGGYALEMSVRHSLEHLWGKDLAEVLSIDNPLKTIWSDHPKNEWSDQPAHSV